jgi:hypothetical protein
VSGIARTLHVFAASPFKSYGFQLRNLPIMHGSRENSWEFWFGAR